MSEFKSLRACLFEGFVDAGVRDPQDPDLIWAMPAILNLPAEKARGPNLGGFHSRIGYVSPSIKPPRSALISK
jgi:hypothetical protein